jgi:hypothetical protein
MIEAVKKGDRIVTIGGIHGTVHAVKEGTVVVKVDDDCRIEFSKSAVATVSASKVEEKAAEEPAPAAEKPIRPKKQQRSPKKKRNSLRRPDSLPPQVLGRGPAALCHGAADRTRVYAYKVELPE